MGIAFIAALAGLVLCCLGAAALCRRYFETGMLYRVSVVSQTAAIPALRAVMPVIDQELARARRHERPLSVVVLEIRGQELLQQIRMLMSTGYLKFFPRHWHAAQVVRVVFSLIGCLLRDALRDTDLVGYDPICDRYIIVMPETDKVAAHNAIERVREVLLKRTAAEVHATITEFPLDGLTLEDLLRAADVMGRPESDNIASEAAA